MATYKQSNPLIDELESLDLKVSDIFDDKKIKYKRGGKDLLICCPFHEDTKPSLSVQENGIAFYCFGCKTKGTIVKLLAKLEGKNYRAILEELGIDIEEDKIPTDEKLQTLLNELKKIEELQNKEQEYNYLDESFLDKYKIIGMADIPLYLLQRFKGDYKGVLQLVEKFGLGYDQKNKFVTIPIRDENGVLQAIYGRNTDLKSSQRYKIFEKAEGFSKSNYIFNIDNNIDSEELIVFEGPFNAMLMNLYGFTNAVSFFGTDITDRHVDLLIKNRRRIFLWVDEDKAGTSCLINLYKKLTGKIDLYYLQTPYDVFDYTKEDTFKWMQHFQPLLVMNNQILKL